MKENNSEVLELTFYIWKQITNKYSEIKESFIIYNNSIQFK